MRESPLRASAQEFHKGWIAACGEKGRVAQRIAVQLFPRAGPMIGGSEHVSGNDAEWRIARRICADEVFESYFRYSLGDAFSRLEYLRVLAEGSTQDGARVLRRLAGERTPDGFTRLRRFADMLRDALFVEGMALAQPQDLMGSLCAVGDLAIAGGRNDMITPDDLLLVLIIVRLLASLPISEQRSALQAGLDRAGFDFAARVVSFVGASHGRYGEPASPTEEHAVLESEGDLDYLERYIATRLRAAARDGSLWGKSRVWPLVVFWSKIDPAEARAAVQQWTVDDTNFLHLVLGLVIKDTDVRARLPAKMRWRFNAKTAAAAFDLTTLRPRVTSLLQRGELTNEARETLSLLLEAGSDPEQS